MKSQKVTRQIVRALFLFLLLSGCGKQYIKQPAEISLSSGWYLTEANLTSDSIEASVPGAVQYDVLKSRGLINDNRFYNVMGNDSLYRDIEKKEWIYSKSVSIDDTLLRYRHIDLVLEGIDTYGRIRVNDSLVQTTGNSFRRWRIPVKELLKSGANTLSVEILSPSRIGEELKNQSPFSLPAGDPVSPVISPYVRKAGYQFGWDWSPRMLTMGVTGNVLLEAWDGIRIEHVLIKTTEITDSCAWLKAEIKLQATVLNQNVVLKIGDAFREIRISSYDTTVNIPFRISEPELWWPNGMGQQMLYTITAQCYVNGMLTDEHSVRTGIRTAELVTAADSAGTSFFFKINNVPVFAKGANYVPQSIITTQVTESDYRRIISDAASVGMNMLRVWGGGIYERDVFYALCDEAGLMVWQDFMFACAMYPPDENFISDVEKEVAEQVVRLHNHPSVVLWCGNNESDVAWKNWGWQEQFNIAPSDSVKIRQGYETLFMKRIPETVNRIDGSRNYIHSSPLSNWGKKENFNHLNMHYWGVWHGEEAIDSFRVNVPRFMAEYGMQSYPSFKSLQRAGMPAATTVDSPFISARQKSYKGNKLLISYINQRYGAFSSAEDLCYLSQLHQADAMEIAIESHRKKRGHCMGSLYWQLNDVWDGASWSTIEYDGTWKAPHYALHRLYASDIIIPESKNDTLCFYLQSESPVNENVFFECGIYNLNGVLLEYYKRSAKVTGTEAFRIYEISSAALKKNGALKDIYLKAHISRNDVITATRIYFPAKPAEMNLAPAVIFAEVKKEGKYVSVLLSANRLVKNIHLNFEGFEGRFSDNYFDLLPNESREIRFYPTAVSSLPGRSDLKFKYYLPPDR